MKHLWETIKNFIATDVKSETETKDLAVLLRIVCLLYALYYLVSVPLLATMHYYVTSLILLFVVGIMVACFILTYEERTKLSLQIFYTTILFISSLLTIQIGWGMNYQWSFMIIIMMTFFSLDRNPDEKNRRIRFVFFVFLTISIISLVFPVLLQPTGFIKVAIHLNSVLFYTSIVSAVAYMFSIKFNQAEEKLRQINDKLSIMASLDALTKLPNRRSMNDHLNSLVYEYKRSGKEFCIAIGDVDHFKLINDDYGHDTGDFILTTLSEMFQDAMKSNGFVARWGGEEFLFTFEGMTPQQAYSQLEILRIKIDQHTFIYKDHTVHISMTFGMEEFSSILTVESTISKADAKLYQGKTSGRNQVVI